MRRLSFIASILLVGTVAPQWAFAQAPAPAPAPAQGAAPAATEPADASRSLFEVTDRELFIGGRATSIDGDPARFQRYQDVRDGLLFTGFRWSFAPADGANTFKARANNVGWRDQEYFANYNRVGKLSVTGSYQQIPQFYSVDTKTPYTGSGGTLSLDDATQRAIQNGQANLNAYVPLAPQFELRERRDIGRVDVVATPTPKLDVTASFTTQKHGGELPWGASFGFSNDVEVPLPYQSRTNDFTIGTEWTNTKNMLRVAYTGSWFDNQASTLVWDSPLALDDKSGTPGRGRMSLWPSNSAQTVSVGGYSKLARKTQVTGFFSYGLWSNDQPLQPFTINSALPTIPLPRANTDAEAHVFSTNLNLTSHPADDWRFGARFRNYTYSNHMPVTSITNYVAYDSSVSTTPTGGPDLYAHDRTTFDADATWDKKPVALTVGYTLNANGFDARTFKSNSENVFRVSADAVGTQWATFRIQYEVGSRTGSGLNEKQLTDIGEHPEMRYYDLADRTRNRFSGQVDITPSDAWLFSVSGGLLHDDYKNTVFGLQKSNGDTFSLAADYHQPNGLGAGATYNFERYTGRQQSHEGDSSDAQFNDPLRNWTADATETVNYFSIYATPPRIGPNTELRFSYDFSYAAANNLYTIPVGSPITTPNQLPEVYNKLQQLHIDARHRLTRNLAAWFSYLYEPLRIYDYAFDPSVVNGIVQPSSLVMGYVYRPYTANSFQFGLRYLW